MGGKVSGGQFIIQGQSEKPVAVCEGFATGTSIHLATGWTVYVAFSANNLARVAKTVKERFPDKTIIICGDNDEAGLRKGEDAAGLANAQLLFPHFTDDNGTDLMTFTRLKALSRPLATGNGADQTARSYRSGHGRISFHVHT